MHIPSLTPIPLLGSMATNRHSARELAADYGDTQLIAELSSVSLEFTPEFPRSSPPRSHSTRTQSTKFYSKTSRGQPLPVVLNTPMLAQLLVAGWPKSCCRKSASLTLRHESLGKEEEM